MKKILITGVSSFFGYHLAKKFSEKNKVIGSISKEISSYADEEKLRLSDLKDSIEFIPIDLLTPGSAKEVILKFRPDYVIHHAGYATNYGSYDYDMELSLKINVLPLREIFQASKEVGTSGILVTGTCMEYGDSDEVHSEDENCEPSTPYGVSKLAETKRAIQLSKEFDLPLRVLRIFNPFGKFESSRKLFPYLIGNLGASNTVDLSPCTQVRNLDHAPHIAEIYQFAIDDLEKRGGYDIFNASSKNGIILKDFLEMIAEKMGKEASLLNFGAKEMRATEVLRQESSFAKIEKLGFKKSSYEEDISDFIETL